MEAEPETETNLQPVLIKQRSNDKILRLTLNRPKALNCLSLELLNELLIAFDEAANDKTICAIIINGAGPGFCAGHDLKHINSKRSENDGGRAYFETLFNTCTEMMLKIASLPIPVIAEVHKIAAAAGCQLVASCDLAVAENETIFAVNGIDAGLFCSTPQVALSRNIPRKAAMEMLMLGERIDATRALNLGLINRAVPNEQLEATSMKLASKAAERSREVIALGKKAFYQQIEMNVKKAYDQMNKVIVENLLLPDADCGIKAFIDKTKPDWPSQDE